MSTAGPPSVEPQGIPGEALVEALEQQLGQAAGQIARLQILLRMSDTTRTRQEDEIRYLRSLLPADTPGKEAGRGDNDAEPGAPEA